MPRNMVGLLAAVGAAMSALVSLAHGDAIPVMIAGAACATGLATSLALSPSKKTLTGHICMDVHSKALKSM